MNFLLYLLALACLCASVIAGPHTVAKHESTKIREAHKKISKSTKPISDASMKNPIDSEENPLSRAIDILTPLARDGFGIGLDFAKRIIFEADNGTKSKASGANLWPRVDRLIAEASGAYKSLTGQGLKITIPGEKKGNLDKTLDFAEGLFYGK